MQTQTSGLAQQPGYIFSYPLSSWAPSCGIGAEGIWFGERSAALLAALALPTPRGDGGHQWHRALLDAFRQRDALPWLAFADWCCEEGYWLWEEIARETAARWAHPS